MTGLFNMNMKGDGILFFSFRSTGKEPNMETANLHRILKPGVRLIGIVLTLYVIYVTFFPLPPLQERALFALLLVLLLFLRESTKRVSLPWVLTNVVFCFAVTIVFGYITLFHESVTAQVGITNVVEVVLGILAVILVLEGVRRVMGLGLTLVILGFLLYGILGQFIPPELGGHTGFGVDRIITTLYLSTNGLFGQVIYVMYKYVFLFILFGCILEETGALSFILDLARSLVGQIRGGPAMISVISSGLTGTISGSAVANVVIDGFITIPTMKSVGFKPHVAAAIEAAASTGGQLMPPVMGAAAFLIAQNLSISYIEVCKAAAIPAIIYYLTLLGAVYVYATRCQLKGLPREELPKLKEVLSRITGLTFFGGVGVLLVFLLLRYSPIYAVVRGILAMIIISLIGKERITPRKAVRVLETTATSFLDVGMAGVGVGIIVGILLLTGLSTRFSSLILVWGGGNLVLSLVFTMVVAIILGMGLPTTVVYILLSISVAPAVVKMGIVPIGAHLFVFYGGMMSMITPPVALAAYAAASIAGANLWQTGVAAVIFMLPAYLLPFIFVTDNSLMLMGNVLQVFLITLRTLVVCFALVFALNGPAKDAREIMRRCVTGIGGVLLAIQIYWVDVISLLLIFIPILWQFKDKLAKYMPSKRQME